MLRKIGYGQWFGNVNSFVNIVPIVCMRFDEIWSWNSQIFTFAWKRDLLPVYCLSLILLVVLGHGTKLSLTNQNTVVVSMTKTIIWGVNRDINPCIYSAIYISKQSIRQKQMWWGMSSLTFGICINQREQHTKCMILHNSQYLHWRDVCAQLTCQILQICITGNIFPLTRSLCALSMSNITDINIQLFR